MVDKILVGLIFLAIISWLTRTIILCLKDNEVSWWWTCAEQITVAPHKIAKIRYFNGVMTPILYIWPTFLIEDSGWENKPEFSWRIEWRPMSKWRSFLKRSERG